MEASSTNQRNEENPDLQTFEIDETYDDNDQSMNALEILRETVRILRYNSTAFMSITALFICPLSAILMSNIVNDHSIVKRLTIRLLLVAKSSGYPLNPIIRQSCQKFSEVAVSSVMCFPLYITLSLLSKAAIVYTVDSTYKRRTFETLKFYSKITKIWKRIVLTYLWVSGVIGGCFTLFLIFLLAVSSAFTLIGFPPDLILYPAMVVGVIFSVIFANAIIICNIAIVISVLEDISGPQALLRSSSLVKGQTQVGLLIFLGSTIGMSFVQGLFEHRVKSLSYGDGSSRIWEGPLLVVMYSFVVLIDSINSSVFYFSCKLYSLEESDIESQMGSDPIPEI